jgi:ABC-2 type transport system ATP-binding protein
VIEVEHLEKKYADVTAVSDVSFTAEPGKIFGLLGPNGAGKSTTIGCISSLLEPSAGRIRVLGHDVVAERRAAKEKLGVVPQELALYEDLSATENLRYWGAAYGLRGKDLAQRVREVLADTGLVDRAKEPVKRFSGGMKRRLNLGCGIVHRPRVLLLDEPTVGVDPQSRVRLLEVVRQQVAAGTCLLYTTHYLEEAETLCDRIAIIDHGKIIAAGTLTELRGMVGERDTVRLAGRFDPARAREALGQVEGAEVVQADGDEVRLALREASQKLPQLFAALTSAGAVVRETTVTRPSLESVFIHLTGKELRE